MTPVTPLPGRPRPPGAVRRVVRRLTLRTRLTLIAATAVAVAVAAVATSAYLVVRGQLRAQVDASLAADQVQPLLTALVSQRRFGPGGAPKVPSVFAAVDLVDARGNASTVLADILGRVQITSTDLSVAAGQRSSLLRDGRLSDGTRVRVAVYPAIVGGDDPVAGGPRRLALLVARSMDETDTALARLRALLLLAGGLGVLAAAGGGLLVARAGLRPVDRLTAAAEHVARTEDLDAPIEVTGDDEVGRLARSFNAMVAALSASRERQRRLVADAGHELRTPLTSLRTNLELLVRSERAGRPLPEPDRARLLDDLASQVDELSTLVGELTDLAREERSAPSREVVDLAEVVARAADRVRRRSGDVRVVAELSACLVVGDRGELERAVLNVLDNAVKFSPPGAVVEVRLAGGELTVADRGPGVAEEDRAHVFDRFYRASAARAQPGSGLGLSIVAQAVAQHGGAVRLEGRPGGGTLARLWLPTAPARSDPADLPVPSEPSDPPAPSAQWEGTRSPAAADLSRR